MAVTPKIITIIDYIKDTILPKVSAGGNYNYTLATISKDFIPPEQLRDDQLPAAFIVNEGIVTFSPMTAGEYTVGRDLSSVVDGDIIQIVCVIKVAEAADLEVTGALSDAMDKLYSDVVVAWHTDRDLGGNVNAGTALIGKVKSFEYMDTKLGVVIVMFSVNYYFNPGTPVT